MPALSAERSPDEISQMSPVSPIREFDFLAACARRTMKLRERINSRAATQREDRPLMQAAAKLARSIHKFWDIMSSWTKSRQIVVIKKKRVVVSASACNESRA